MSVMIQSWCKGDKCDPCQPPPTTGGGPSGGGGTGGIPLFSDGNVVVNQVQIVTDARGNISRHLIGSVTYTTYHLSSSGPEGFSVVGSFGTPLIWTAPYTYTNTYESSLTIAHPWMSNPIYSLTTYSSGVQSGGIDPVGDAQSTQNAQNAAVAQAYNTLGWPMP